MIAALSAFPEEINPGAGKAPGLGILFDSNTRSDFDNAYIHAFDHARNST